MMAVNTRKTGRWVRMGVWIAGVPLAVGIAIFLFWAWSTLPQTDGQVRLAGISGEVEIFRDEFGVPHIFAETANDAYFTLGYVHAQDRLWQMEFTRRLGAGRLAEVVGETGLRADRFFRTLGIYRQAESAVQELSERARGGLEAYAAGVNARLENRSGSLPPEFSLLGYEPEPWRVADSIVWGQLLAFQLSTNWREELYRAALLRNLSAERVAELWPGDPSDAPVTLDAARRTAKLDVRAILQAVPSEAKSFSASNAWAISSTHSVTGAPILANDTHLGFATPNIWYLARIVTPELSVTGATAPGVPFTILGHNNSVAWGMTSTGGDTQDLFVESISPEDPTRYRTPEGWQPMDIVEETIRVKGAEDIKLTLRRTRHGPVISDVLDDSRGTAEEGTALSLASASDGAGSRTIEALSGIPFAHNASEFERIAADFQTPLVNIFFADRLGTIGLITPGLVPVRRNGDGRYPVDGASGEFDWIGFVPASAMPRIVDPDAGMLVNANNRLVGTEYPYMITRDWDDPYRAERIHQLLKAVKKHSVEDAMRQQDDILSVAARDLLPRMIEAAEIGPDSKDAKALGLLTNWDYRMEAGRPEPLIYTAWLRHAVRRIAEDELGENFPAYWRPRPAFVNYVLADGRHWCAKRDCAEELQAALSDALGEIRTELGDDIQAWRWGDLHSARFDHRLFTQLPVVGAFGSLSIPTGGGDNTIGRGMTAGKGVEPYAHIHGAVYKAVYNLADLTESYFMIPVGQSGNPFSRNYSDLLEPWRNGKSIRLDGDREVLSEAGYDRLVLRPAVQ